MDAEVVRQIIGSLVSLSIVLMIVLIVRWALAAKKDVPRIIALLPSDIQKILTDAAKQASEFVELMDANGQLREKGEEKLNLAVDFAVQYLEGVFKNNGFDINIDEGEIKKAIQKYVWQNPDLFPSKDGKTALIPQTKDGDSGRSLT